MADLNPQIVELPIGIKELRKITIYPLSMADQFKMTDVIAQAVHQFGNVDVDLGDEEVVQRMLGLIEENIDRLLKLVLDEDEEVSMSELSNEQFTDICNTIFEVNYEGSVKKLTDLVGKVKAVMPRMGPSPTPAVESQ